MNQTSPECCNHNLIQDIGLTCTLPKNHEGEHETSSPSDAAARMAFRILDLEAENKRLVPAEHLVAASDIADWFKVKPSAISNWKQRYDSFPKPIAIVARGKVALWLREDIAVWYRQRISTGDELVVPPGMLSYRQST